MTIIPLPIPPEATKAIAEEAMALLKTFLGPAMTEAGALGGSYLRLFRFEREVNFLRRAQKIVADAGFTAKAVNMRVLFPLLDAAVLEENEDMVERWASLLAAAANPDNQSALEASFIEILKQLAPTHALLLEIFYEQVERNKLPPEEWQERGYSLKTLKSYLRKEVPDFDVAIENLFRLNLVAHPTAKLGIANGQEVRIHVTSADILCATSLGSAFITACGHGRSWRTTSYGVPGNSISNVFWTRGGSLKIMPSPSPKRIPPGAISPELKAIVEAEALEVAKQSGCPVRGVGLIQRRLIFGMRAGEWRDQGLGPLSDFCEDRGLQLKISCT